MCLVVYLAKPAKSQNITTVLERILLLNGYPMGTVKYHMNDVIDKHQNKPKDPVQTAKKKEVLIVLPFLGHHSKQLTKQLRSCINKFYGIFNVRMAFQNTRTIKSFLPYKDKLQWATKVF